MSERGGAVVARARWDLERYDSFADLLRDAMAGQTQASVAAACGVSQGRVSRWLSGTTQPGKADVVARVAAWLGVSTRALRAALARWRPEEVEPSAAAELR